MDTQVSRNPRAVLQELAGDQGAVVLDLDSAEYYGLDEVAVVFWRLIGDGGTTVGQLVDRVRETFEDSPPDVAHDVVDFVQGLAQRQLVTLGGQAG